MKTLIQSCFVYLATTKETFGIGILEAMASGVPVLGYNYGGAKDLVEHGVNGYLVKPKDAKAMAGRLDHLLSNEGARKGMAEKALEMSGRYRWSNITNEYMAAYDSLLSNRID